VTVEPLSQFSESRSATPDHFLSIISVVETVSQAQKAPALTSFSRSGNSRKEEETGADAK
jgi:hypothetical protein